ECFRAPLGCRNHGSAVSGTKVNNVIFGRDLGEIEHLIDQRLRSRNPHDIFSLLPDMRLIFFLRRLRVRCCDKNETQKEQPIAQSVPSHRHSSRSEFLNFWRNSSRPSNPYSNAAPISSWLVVNTAQA